MKIKVSKNRASKIIGLSFLLGLFFLSGCNTYHYAPGDGNLLALAEKGDLKVAAGGNVVGKTRSYSIQAGYSPIKHLAAKGQFFRIKDALPNNNGNNFYGSYRETVGRGFLAEACVGGYLTSRNWRVGEEDELGKYVMPLQSSFDAYLGYGKGSVQNDYSYSSFGYGYGYYGGTPFQTAGDSRLEFNKYFMQVGAHLSLYSIGLDFGFRGGLLDYYSAKLNGKVGETDETDIYKIEEFDPIFTFETSFRFQVGIKHARMFLSGTVARYNEELNHLFKPSVFQWGVVLDLDEMFKKKVK